MSTTLPTTTKSLVLHKTDPVDGKVYHDAVLEDRPIPILEPGQLLVKVVAAGFNRRDVSYSTDLVRWYADMLTHLRQLWMRMGLYPGIQFDTVMGSDAAGTCTSL
jgi:NADPH:quinone reductase-like Zn-dependent oxidoreductase